MAADPAPPPAGRTFWSPPLVALIALAALTTPGPRDGSGPLHLVSLTEWREPHKGFGGFSGLALDPDGKGFLTVSDRGLLVHAHLDRDGAGRLTGATWTDAKQFLDSKGNEVAGFTSDSEALRRLPDGRIAVAFEGLARVAAFAPPDMRPMLLSRWDRFKAFWGNTGMESLAVRPDGSLMTVLELPTADGSYQSFTSKTAPVWTAGPPLPSDGRFEATDAVWAPDGRLFLLERNFAVWRGYTTRITAYRMTDQGFGAPTLLWQSPRGAYGDFEGMDVTTLPSGGLRVTLITDNNFLPMAATMIAELDMAPEAVADGKIDG